MIKNRIIQTKKTFFLLIINAKSCIFGSFSRFLPEILAKCYKLSTNRTESMTYGRVGKMTVQIAKSGILVLLNSVVGAIIFKQIPKNCHICLF